MTVASAVMSGRSASRPRLGTLGRVTRATFAPLLLALATATFCWKLLTGGLVVIGYDTMTYMYPYRYAAAAALRDGHLPLWNPHIFYGVPFVANLQSAVFYPLHVLFLVMPPTTAMNWSVVLHLFLASLFAYLAALRILEIDHLSAAITGALYGLSGFVGSQVGHLNQLNAAAWLPLAFLTLHHAIASRSLRWVAVTAGVLAIQLLAGHAQETYMTAVALGAYATFHALAAVTRALRAPRPAGWRVFDPLGDSAFALGGVVIAGALAGGIAAVQLLPTNELTHFSIRASGMSFGEAVSFSLPPRELFVGMLPAFGLASPTSNEYLGWIGFSGIALVVFGVLFRVHRPVVFFFFLLALISFLLALGNHFPLYEWVFHLPGMRLFRVPARWLMLTTLAAAMLAGAGLAFIRLLGAQGWSLTTRYAPDVPIGPWQRLAASSRLLLAIGVLLLAAAAIWPFQRPSPLPPTLIAVWAGLAGTTGALSFWALAAAPSRWPGAIFAAFVLAELFMASRSLEYNNPNPSGVYTAPVPVHEALHRLAGPADRLLSVAATGYHPSNAKALVAGYEPILGAKGVEATLINVKYKETLSPNLPMVYGARSIDGYDGGVLPLQRYVDYKRLVVRPDQNVPDALLRDQLARVPPVDHLRTLGASFILADAIADVTRDGVYYDLAGSLQLAPGEQVHLRHAGASPSGGVTAPVSAIGIISSLDGGASIARSTPVAAVTLGRGSETLWRGTLLAGEHTAEGAYSSAARHEQPPALGPAAAGGSATSTYHAHLSIPAVSGVEWVAVRSLISTGAAHVRVHGLSLIGEAGLSWPVTLAGGGSLRLVHRSDVKLYRYDGALPRAYVVGEALVVDGVDDAVASLSRGDHDQRTQVVLERGAPADSSPPGRRSWFGAAARAFFALLGIDRHATGGVWSASASPSPAGAGAAPGDVPAPLVRAGLVRTTSRTTNARGETFIVSAPLPGSTPLGETAPAVEWIDDRPEHIAIRAVAPQGGLLVLRDSFFPGWTARVNGREAEILRADILFRAIPLPPGRAEPHVVDLTYRSRPLERGFFLTLVALGITVALAALPLDRARRRWTERRAAGAAG